MIASFVVDDGSCVGCIAGGRWHDQIVCLKYQSTLACPALIGMAVAEFLASGGYDRHQRRPRSAVSGNLERYREAIAIQFPDGTRVSTPRGGFVLWVGATTGCRRARASRAGVASADRDRAGLAVLRAPAVHELHPHLGGIAMVGSDR